MLDAVYKLAKALEAGIGWIFSPSWLPPRDFEFLRWLVIPGYGYGFILVVFGLLELIIPRDRRPWGRATLLSGTYVLLAGKMGVYTIVITPLIRNTWVYLGIPSFHLDRVLPWPVYMLTSVLILTFLHYWAHRGLHQIPALWHIHKIHHSPTNLNWSSIYHKHFLELILHTPLSVMASLTLGTELVAPFGIIFIAVDVLGHSNVRMRLPRLSYFISTPQVHRIHHSILPQHYDTNFGNTFMLWDHLFGTYRYDAEAPPTGVDSYVPVSFLKQQILPLVWIATDSFRWAMRLGSTGLRLVTGLPTRGAGQD
jgi:sterol desaturase/sphingolipid hydroxylase (fatty acid hydroxylase superfamily)